MKTRLFVAGSIFLTLTIAVSLEAAIVSGTVRTKEGAAVAGAMVTVFNYEFSWEAVSYDRKQTVYTDKNGQYVIVVSFDGETVLRVRAPQFRDAESDLTLEESDVIQRDIVLAKEWDDNAASDALPASAHAATLPFASPNGKDAFVSQCNFCHQVGNALTRVPRPEDKWRDTVYRMEGYAALLTHDQTDEIVQALHQGFDGAPLKTIHTPDHHEKLADAKIEEWLVGDEFSFIHDTDVAADGNLYGVDQAHDIVWELDRATGEITQHLMPDPGLPIGGKLSGMPLPFAIFKSKHGPHSLAEDAQGQFWITGSFSSELVSFDTHTKAFKSYPISDDALYPHTIRVDQQGIVWFTIAVSNQVARFDPKSEEMTVLALPTRGALESITYWALPKLAKMASWFEPDEKTHLRTQNSPHKWSLGRDAISVPYGIDISPIDGRVWYAKLHAHKIGVIDPDTLAVEEFDTPLQGPRRHRFDSQGNLWIPSFDESGLMKFDPVAKSFKTYRMPTLADGEWETPYALNVHPETDEVWITSNNSDRIFRFNPQTETFASYPSPTRVTFLRDLVFTQDGKVCSSQSNMPSYGIEGGRPSFICLDPTGGLKDRGTLESAAR